MEKLQPKIEMIAEKKVIGMRKRMSFSNYSAHSLWKNFMPRKNEISHQVTSDLISLTIYQPTHFSNFCSNNEFEKWAAVEVSELGNIPIEMESFILASGWYAIFHYQGLSNDSTLFENIFTRWLPNSEYVLDQRPHFELLGKNYKNNDPLSEEDIFIPVKLKYK